MADVIDAPTAIVIVVNFPFTVSVIVVSPMLIPLIEAMLILAAMVIVVSLPLTVSVIVVWPMLIPLIIVEVAAADLATVAVGTADMLIVIEVVEAAVDRPKKANVISE